MPTGTGFGALLAGMLPDHLRYEDSARAVCLRLEYVIDAIAPLRAPAESEPGVVYHVNPNLTDGIDRRDGAATLADLEAAARDLRDPPEGT